MQLLKSSRKNQCFYKLQLKHLIEAGDFLNIFLRFWGFFTFIFLQTFFLYKKKKTEYMWTSKRKLLLNAFFKAQLSYCPVIWMCQSRVMNNKINRLNERCFTIIYNGKTWAFADLLAKSGSVTIHIRNLQVLATEMFKVCK